MSDVGGFERDHVTMATGANDDAESAGLCLRLPFTKTQVLNVAILHTQINTGPSAAVLPGQ